MGENGISWYLLGVGFRDCSGTALVLLPADVSFCTSLRCLIYLPFKTILCNHPTGQQDVSSFQSYNNNPTVLADKFKPLEMPHLASKNKLDKYDLELES